MSLPFKVMQRIVSKAFIAGGYLSYFGCVVYCTLEYVGDFVICQGPSMEPTIISNDIVLTEHISVMLKKIKKGDIIVSKSPSNPKQYICKRVLAMPGDKVRKGFLASVVPQGHVWLEGDNKSNSTDSRDYGPVPIGLIRSKAVCRIYPFKRARIFVKSSK